MPTFNTIPASDILVKIDSSTKNISYIEPNNTSNDETIAPLEKLQRDLRKIAGGLTRKDAKFFINLYYSVQDNRKRFNQYNYALFDNEPDIRKSDLFQFFAVQLNEVEENIRKAMQTYAESKPLGRWLLSQHGIGPVIAAGLLAYIDFERKNSEGQYEITSAGHIWSYAGQLPNAKLKKGQKINYNPALKVLCWKIGQSFLKQSGNPRSYYGKLLKQREAYEIAKNENGDYTEQAAAILKEKNFEDGTTAKTYYLQGKLPPAHIKARACKWAVRIFLAHYFEVGYEMLHNVPPPKPYAIEYLGHVDYLPPMVYDK